MASSSHLAFDLVTRNVLPRMVLIWDDLNSRDKKTLFLGVLNDLLQARLDLRDASRIAVHDPLQDPAVVQSIQSNEASLARSLTQYQQSLVDDILFTAMMEHDSENDAIHTPFGINVIKGLVLGARIPRFLSDYHKGTIISKFNDLLVQRSQAVAVHHEVVSALQQISVEDPDRFRDITMSTVMNSLPNYVSSDKDDLVDELNDIVFVLEALTQVACTGTCKVQYVIIPSNVVSNFRFRVFDQFQRSLMRKLFDVLLLQHQLPYANAILAAMFRGLELFDETLAQEDAAGDVVPVLDPRTSPYAWIVIDLFRKLIKQKQHENGTLKSLSYMGFAISLDDDPKVTDRFVSLLGRIATLALRSDQTTPMGNFLFNMDRDMIQEQRPSQVWYLFCEEKPADLISMSQPSLDYGPAEKCLTNVLSMSLVAGIRREVSTHSISCQRTTDSSNRTRNNCRSTSEMRPCT
jgi:DNA repair/transcription protein MET18/MMS19